MDVFSREKRSAVMAAVKQKNTAPEHLVRRYLHRHGFRFRLHDKRLPGKPDIVLPKYRTVVFVHGCFWHGHPDCPRARRPTTRTAFWDAKLDRNLARDADTQAALADLGWRVEIVWSCTAADAAVLDALIARLHAAG